MDTFEKLKQLNKLRQAEWDSENKIDLAFRGLEFMAECGELAEQVKKFIRQNNGLKGNTTDLSKIRDEVGDAVITLTLLCADIEELTGETIDISKAVQDKFNKTSNKYNFKTIW